MNEISPRKDPLDGPVVLTIPVQWGDQDAFHLEPIVDLLQGSRIGPILVSIHCDYRHQLSHPDTIQVTARIRKIGRTSMVMEHQIYSQQQDMVVSEGNSTLVLFDYANNEPLAVSDDLRRVIESLEGGPVDDR